MRSCGARAAESERVCRYKDVRGTAARRDAGRGAAPVPGAGRDHAGEDPGGGVRARGAGGEPAAQTALRGAGERV